MPHARKRKFGEMKIPRKRKKRRSNGRENFAYTKWLQESGSRLRAKNKTPHHNHKKLYAEYCREMVLSGLVNDPSTGHWVNSTKVHVSGKAHSMARNGCAGKKVC